MMGLEEEDLVDLLSSVLVINDEEEIDGLEDLIPYISGLISTQLQELEVGDTSAAEEILEESMVPFLDSVGLPDDRIQTAVTAILERLQTTATTVKATANTNGNSGQTKKLTQKPKKNN